MIDTKYSVVLFPSIFSDISVPGIIVEFISAVIMSLIVIRPETKLKLFEPMVNIVAIGNKPVLEDHNLSVKIGIEMLNVSL